MPLTTSLAFIPNTIAKSQNKLLSEVIFLALGVGLLSCLAQVAIRLPWTPVPITGQTFGIAMIGLSWGSKRSLRVVASYLTLGALGLPIFAQASSGLSVGPTFGYLIGMLLASFVVGKMADRGFTTTLGKSLLAAYVGSLIIFSCGLIVLSFFVPRENLLMAGLIPFIPGDLIKNLLAASLTRTIYRLDKK